MILLLLGNLEIKQPFSDRENVCFRLYIDNHVSMTFFFFSDKFLNADTRLIRTLGNVPLVFLIKRVPL